MGVNFRWTGGWVDGWIHGGEVDGGIHGGDMDGWMHGGESIGGEMERCIRGG